jgi:hypothetical protein
LTLRRTYAALCIAQVHHDLPPGDAHRTRITEEVREEPSEESLLSFFFGLVIA